MKTPDIFYSKVLKVFIKGSFVLIGLFFALSCIVAVLLFSFDKSSVVGRNNIINKYIENIEYIENSQTDKTTENKIDEIKTKVCALIKVLIIPLFVFLIFFIILFFSFSYFVRMYNKTSCDRCKVNISIMQKNEEIHFKKYKIDKLSHLFISTVKVIDSESDKLGDLYLSKIKVTDFEPDKLSELYLSVAEAINSKSGNAVNLLKGILDELLCQLSEISSEEKKNSSENSIGGEQKSTKFKVKCCSRNSLVGGDKYTCYVHPEAE